MYFRFTAVRHEFLMHLNFSGVFLQYLLLYIQYVTVSKDKSLQLTKLNVSFLPQQNVHQTKS